MSAVALLFVALIIYTSATTLNCVADALNDVACEQHGGRFSLDHRECD
jgi:hypothetical protein